MSWGDVGEWLKGNAGTGAALIGSLLTGNVPGAVAAGVSLVSSATGSTDPDSALRTLMESPEARTRLAELQHLEQASIRGHIAEMARIEIEDAAASHHETQETIRAGDKADDRLVRWTRPLQSWLSLFAAIAYIFTAPEADGYVLASLLALPCAYAGLRGMDKAMSTLAGRVKRAKQ